MRSEPTARVHHVTRRCGGCGPIAARAEEVMSVVGFLSSLLREGAVQLEAAFQQGLGHK
jgi:hypothetical protein